MSGISKDQLTQVSERMTRISQKKSHELLPRYTTNHLRPALLPLTPSNMLKYSTPTKRPAPIAHQHSTMHKQQHYSCANPQAHFAPALTPDSSGHVHHSVPGERSPRPGLLLGDKVSQSKHYDGRHKRSGPSWRGSNTQGAYVCACVRIRACVRILQHS